MNEMPAGRLSTRRRGYFLALKCVVLAYLFVSIASPADASGEGAALAPFPPHILSALDADQDIPTLVTAVENSIRALRDKPSENFLPLNDGKVALGRVRESLVLFRSLLEVKDSTFGEILKAFDVFPASTPVLFTGYHEPELPGSLIRSDQYRYPLYRVPADLTRKDQVGSVSIGRTENGRFLPYFSRADIDGRGVLHQKSKVLVWLDDPVERFFLHIQGSGKIRLEDGTWFRAGYAASNGLPYRSIGKLLLAENKLGPGEATAQGIRNYLRDHPSKQETIFFHNPRYIFFRVISAGPLGSLGVPLTPLRSIAIDPKSYPLGAVALVRTKRPTIGPDGVISWTTFSRLVCLQDQGAAISGPGRADIYWGSGAQPEAGLMAQHGELYILLKKG